MTNYPANAYRFKIEELLAEIRSHTETFGICAELESNEDDKAGYQNLIRLNLEVADALTKLRDQHEQNRSYQFARETF